MAESGGQPNNLNRLKGKRWSDAIDRALDKRSKARGIEALEELAEQFLEEVEEAGINGYKELGDRLEGKAAQQVVHSGDEENPVTLKVIERRIVKQP